MAFIFSTQNPGRGKLSWHLPDSWLDYFFPSPPLLESSALQSLCLFTFLFRPLPGSGPRPSLSSLHGPYPHLIEHRQTHPHPWLAGAPLATSSYVFPLPLQFQPLNWFGFHFILHFSVLVTGRVPRVHSSQDFLSFTEPLKSNQDFKQKPEADACEFKVNPTCRKHLQDLAQIFLGRRDWACLIIDWTISA